jgi:Secretion system C-terminal sorting domain
MKKILSILSVFVSLVLNAQISVTTATFPIANDSLTTKTAINLSGITFSEAPGANQTWDFSKLQSNVRTVETYYAASTGTSKADYPKATLLTKDSTGEFYYRDSVSKFWNMGFGGADPFGFGTNVVTKNSPFQLVRRAMTYPSNFGSKSAFNLALAASAIPAAILDQLPIKPDSIRLNFKQTYADSTDAWGTMKVPAGTFQVLREKRVATIDPLVEAKVGILGWFDVSSFLSAIPNIGSLLQKRATFSYRFFNNVEKTPIAVVTVDSFGKMTSIEYFDKFKTAAEDIKLPENSLILAPNPVHDNLNLIFNDIPKGKYCLEVIDINGKIVLTKQIEILNNTILDLNISSLAQGIYLLGVKGKENQGSIYKKIFKQ